ncbi:MAG: D-glycerate dehydrogenase [Deltaproteobacteria bacterium]|nr:D-glycerate dehydrogenase [Deltaproteobacteria bacterium]
MSSARVLVSLGVPDAALRVLEAAGLTSSRPPGAAPPDLDGAEAWLCLLTDRVDRARLEGAPGLRIVANMAVGTDNVDLEAAADLGVAVSNTPDVLTDATADLAMGLLLAVARALPQHDRYVRAGAFTGWTPTLGVGLDVTGQTLGIVGAGRIGRAVAERARGFSMQVLLHSRDAGTPLDELLERSDFVSLHVPLTPDTRHLIGAAELARMRSNAVLINTARGPVIDEHALVEALRAGQIAGAGLDVFEDEPRLAPGLAELPNVVLCPHLGSATLATRDRMAEIAARNIVECLAGRPLLTPVRHRAEAGERG